MTEVDIVTKNVRVNELPHVFLLVIARETSVLEFASDLGHLIEYNLFLLIFGLAVADISYVERQSSHSILLVVRHFHSKIFNFKIL
jgi:hypothetical protein